MDKRCWMFVVAGFGIAAMALLANHELARLSSPFAQFPGSAGATGFALVSLGLALLLRALARARASKRGARRVLVAVGIYLAIGVPIALISWHNADSQLEAARRPPAILRVEGQRLLINGRVDPSLPIGVNRALERYQISIVEIDSLGGDMAAAERAGQILARRSVPVLVRGRCASACIVLWALSPARRADTGACFGLHRMHLGKLAHTDGIARSALEHKRTDAARALEQAGFNPTLIQRSFAANPRKVLWLDTEDLQQAGVSFEMQHSSAGTRHLQMTADSGRSACHMGTPEVR